MDKRKQKVKVLFAGILAGSMFLGMSQTVTGTELPAVVYAAEFAEPETESAEFMDEKTEEYAAAGGMFADVPANTYYYRPVYWALENNITEGTSATAFSPQADCTRAQVVTFLWRMAGEPQPQSLQTAFTDVAAGSFYEQAVAWAMENGVTTGKTQTTFAPNGICSRAEFVTFLYRAAGEPEIAGGTAQFTDVAAGSFYELPVAWAVENGVTTGTGKNTFSPGAICIRAQVVTFLHRWKTTLKVTECGATPNDETDDTDALNEAIERASNEEDVETIYVPAGVYIINAETGTAITMKSNTNLIMSADTVLRVKGNAWEDYNIIRMNNVENVSITGGKIEGERYKHTAESGEWGMGIGIYDSRNISISNMTISSNWGDGIYLGTTSYADDLYGCDGIKIENCEISDNRRSNISIVDGSNILISGCLIADAKGTAPQCGINIEPNRNENDVIPEDAICRNIIIKNTTVNVLGKGDYWGQFFCFMTINYPDNSIHTADNIQIMNCTFNGDCGNYSGTNTVISDTVINGTFYDEQNTRLINVKYEDIWRN